jgi:ParB family chromosome partitioning protein
MADKIRVSCKVSDFLPLGEISEFQGNFKKRTKKETGQIITSILKFGFSFPFFCWASGENNYCLDGHGRILALREMEKRGYEIPDLPVVYIEAENEAEAKQKILRLNSQYGLIDTDGFRRFIEGLEIDWGDLALPSGGVFEFPGTGGSQGGELAPKEKQVKSFTIGEFRVELTDAEYEELKNRLTLYVNDNVLPAGFFASLLGIENDVKRGIFFLNRNIDGLKGADYNPRSISEEAVRDLAESVRLLGVCRPVIVNMNNNTIIAGHQRVRALKALGIKTAPVFFVRQISAENEARVNQIHNAVEDDGRDTAVTVAAAEIGGGGGYAYVRDITAPKVKTVKELNYINLMLKYGNIDSAVATAAGEVLKGKDYLLACKAMKIPARVYYIETEKRDAALDYLYRDYGQFDYAGKNSESWQQNMAQMNRLNGGGIRAFYSQTYKWALEKHALEGRRVLDFGAGKCAFAEKLAEKGFDIIPVEFFRMKDGKVMYDWCNAQIDRVISAVKTKGLFDVVICDSVLNSVVNKDVEADVINCCAAFLKEGGKLFISGRIYYPVKSDGKCRTVYQLDGDGFTFNMRRGSWYGQRFHKPDEIGPLLESRGLKALEIKADDRTWKALCAKGAINTGECMESVEREFNMVYNKHNGRYQKGTEVREALSCVYG